ncbi:hypothetical protein Btru_060274 [Bulinus truncatus]|nr:hypothetical protein Btru_060274 [Bulinus truncatus]
MASLTLAHTWAEVYQYLPEVSAQRFAQIRGLLAMTKLLVEVGENFTLNSLFNTELGISPSRLIDTLDYYTISTTKPTDYTFALYTLYVNVPKQSFKFLEGWMEHKLGDEKWAKYWCVMSGNSLHIFSSSQPSKNTHVGTIGVGPGSRLVKREGDEKNGYKFDLYTLKKVNRFKTSKFSEREIWRAFIEGIANGSVPENIDLLPGQINDIQISLNEYFKIQKLVRRPLPIPSETPSDTSYESGFDTPNASTSGSYRCDDSDDYLEPVSPKINPPVDNYQQKLIFYTDSRRSDVPSWFFSNCSRELAIQILDRGAKYGNTLMRESSNDSKNLVISKRMESNGGKTETHYIVNRLSTGYKIDVENPHEPMKSLSEVMEFFVETSGRAVTFPMSCNELSKLGISEKIYNHYNTKIVKAVDVPPRNTESVLGQLIISSKYSQTVLTKYSEKNEIAIGIIAPTPHKTLRSKSVPNIAQQTGMKLQALSFSEGLTSNKHSYVNTNQNSLSFDKGKKNIQNDTLPSSPSIQPPPLPPNHPPPLKQSGSFESSREPKRQLPKHSQSLGATDYPNHKQTARYSQSVNENVQMSNARTMIPDMHQGNIPAKSTNSPSEETSDNKENFKKKLEGLLVGSAPRSSGCVQSFSSSGEIPILSKLS